MEPRRVRIGDVIDDYCTRCRLIMNHGVVGMVAEEVRKVRCNTCMFEHVYRRGKVPARKRRETDRLFAEVLRGMGREPDGPEASEAGAETDAEPAPEGDEARAARQAADDPAGGPGTDDAPAAADGAADGEGEPGRPADQDHGVRRKLYTIRRFSGGKPPTGGSTGR